MRTFKFRGYDLNSNCWVFGGIFQNSDEEFCIVTDDGNIKVPSQSVGQFTRYYDSDGQDIFEGDVLLLENKHGWYKTTEVSFDKHLDIFIVSFRDTLEYTINSCKVHVIGTSFEKDLFSKEDFFSIRKELLKNEQN